MGEERWLTNEERYRIYEDASLKKEMTSKAVRKLLGLVEGDKINLERSRKSGLLGNQTVWQIRKKLFSLKSMDAFDKRAQEQLVNDLLFINEDRSLEKRLQVGWQFDEEITSVSYLMLVKSYLKVICIYHKKRCA